MDMLMGSFDMVRWMSDCLIVEEMRCNVLMLEDVMMVSDDDSLQ